MLPVFGFGFCDVSPYVCSDCLSLITVAESSPFVKEVLAQLTTCSPCKTSFLTLVPSRFGFEGRIWVLIAPVPRHCLLVTFIRLTSVTFVF